MKLTKTSVLGLAAAGVLLASLAIPSFATALRTLVLTTLTATTGTITTLTGTSATITTVSSANLTATGPLKVYVRSKAQLDAITPAVGDTYICSNCTIPYSLCTATGAVLNGFARAGSATVGCGTNN